jgi:hypothetical protein
VLTIEDHDGLFPLPLDDAAFVAELERGGPTKRHAIDALVAESERRIGAGEAPSVEELEALAWDVQWRPRLERTAAFVRRAASRRHA